MPQPCLIGPTACSMIMRDLEVPRHLSSRPLMRWQLPPVHMNWQMEGGWPGPGAASGWASSAESAQAEDQSVPAVLVLARPPMPPSPELYFPLQAPQHRTSSSTVETGKFKQMPIIPFHP